MKLTLKPDQVIALVPCATCLASVGHPCVLLINKPHGAPMGWPHYNRRVWAQSVVNRERRKREFFQGFTILTAAILVAIAIAVILGPVFGLYVLDPFFPVWEITPSPEPTFTDTQLETL